MSWFSKNIPDFLCDFRGDTIHPSTLEVMHELGIVEMLLKRPHQKLLQLRDADDAAAKAA